MGAERDETRAELMRLEDRVRIKAGDSDKTPEARKKWLICLEYLEHAVTALQDPFTPPTPTDTEGLPF